MKENKANTVETEERTMIVLDMLLSGLGINEDTTVIKSNDFIDKL